MIYEIILEDEAVHEIQQVYSRYVETSSQTASYFQTEVERSLNHLKSDIADYREVLPGVRVFSLSVFPFNIYYRRVEEKGRLQIIALLHNRRNEDFVLKRLSGS